MGSLQKSKSMSSFRNGEWVTKRAYEPALEEGRQRGYFKESVNEVGPMGETPLLNLTRIGNIDAVEWMLTKGGAPLDQRDERGYPCTHIAAEVGGLYTLQKIAKVGGDDVWKLRDSQGGTALWVAAAQGHHEVVKYLQRLQGDSALFEVNRLGETPLFAAARGGRSLMVEYIYGYGRFASLVRATSAGQTPLQVAAEHGHLDTVNLIVRLGGDPVLDSDSKADTTALDYASRNGRKDVVRFLKQQGATRSGGSIIPVSKGSKPESRACAIL